VSAIPILLADMMMGDYHKPDIGILERGRDISLMDMAGAAYAGQAVISTSKT